MGEESMMEKRNVATCPRKRCDDDDDEMIASAASAMSGKAEKRASAPACGEAFEADERAERECPSM